jgi:hypothetical protein
VFPASFEAPSKFYIFRQVSGDAPAIFFFFSSCFLVGKSCEKRKKKKNRCCLLLVIDVSDRPWIFRPWCFSRTDQVVVQVSDKFSTNVEVLFNDFVICIVCSKLFQLKGEY